MEKKYTDKTSVSCPGSKEEPTHPKIYLKIDASSNTIVCPYCGLIFEYVNTSLK